MPACCSAAAAQECGNRACRLSSRPRSQIFISSLQPLHHTDDMAWLDKAAVVPRGVSWPLAADPVPTDFVPVTQVEETKQMVRLMPLWCTLLVWNLCYAQKASIMVQQAEGMDRKVLFCLEMWCAKRYSGRQRRHLSYAIAHPSSPHFRSGARSSSRLHRCSSSAP